MAELGGGLRNATSARAGSGRGPTEVLSPFGFLEGFFPAIPRRVRARLAARRVGGMESGSERSTTFSLHSIFNQVLKPLDVKTKFYNAEVSSVSVSVSA